MMLKERLILHWDIAVEVIQKWELVYHCKKVAVKNVSKRCCLVSGIKCGPCFSSSLRVYELLVSQHAMNFVDDGV